MELTLFEFVSATVTGSSTPSFVTPLTFKSSLCPALTSLITCKKTPISNSDRVRVKDRVRVRVWVKVGSGSGSRSGPRSGSLSGSGRGQRQGYCRVGVKVGAGLRVGVMVRVSSTSGYGSWTGLEPGLG